MNLIDKVEAKHLQKGVFTDFRPGDTIRVHVKVIEGEKVRNQIFQGTVMQIRGSGMRATFTVRKDSGGVGVERIFPLHSPSIAKIDVSRRGKVRRAKLTYLRGKKGKAGKIQAREEDVTPGVAAAPEAARPEAPAEAPAAEAELAATSEEGSS